jgi:uncharacterized protein YndB with AHSA1/START domain
MKPEIGAKQESSQTGRWSRVPGARGHLSRVESAVLPRRYTEIRSEPKPPASIRVTYQYDASPGRVFDSWLDPAVAGRWLFATASQPIGDVEIDARVGGWFCLVDRQARDTITYSGQYVEIVPARRLAFTLSMEPLANVITRVTVAITHLGKGCELNLTHANVPREHASYVEGRWTGILYGLGVTLDATMCHHNQE